MHLTDDTIPRLASKVRLKHDKVREKELLLLPERVVILNETAASILRLCDGTRSVGVIAEELRQSLTHTADGKGDDKQPADLPDLATMQADILEFITEVVDQGWVEVD